MTNFIEELRWRGMIHDVMPNTEEQLQKETTTAYIGIDPTADSLHIGHLCSVMLLWHFQRSGHKPLLVIGGATGMIGDPSGKSDERNLLDEQTIRHNQNSIKEQLKKFLNFDEKLPNGAEILNNYDWTKEITFLDFVRNIGKHITVNYMMAKDSVKKRLNGEFSAGMSFTEFTYQLLQGFDFLHLYREKKCRLQMGGSDQWGNITTGTELIRRIENGEAFALTCPLITKADGTKFGKTENGNIWLSPKYTSPYKFYQFWLNTTDDDAEQYIKIFTILNKEDIENLIIKHQNAPHLRLLQKRLAEEVTAMVHSDEHLKTAIEASEILFGNATADVLHKMDEDTLLSVFEGVPQFEVKREILKKGIQPLTLLAELLKIFPSKSEARKTILANGLNLNKEKFTDIDKLITDNNLLDNKYLLFQKGKKNYFLVVVK
jgi:tyrosyl-tRNA synthetase